MKANPAVGFLIGTAGFFVTQSTETRARLIAARVCATIMMLLAASALFAYVTGGSIGLETILAADSGAPVPGRMSVQTAVYLEIVGLILILDRTRHRLLVHVTDAISIALVLLVLSVAAGYTFDAANFFGQTAYTRVSPQTLTCMVLLGCAIIGRRTRNGFFAVLVGQEIGSQSARLVLPFAPFLPFLIVGGSAFATHAHWLSTPYAAALAASLCSVLVFIFVLLMARRINDLERELRDMSLTDELTRIHNRRAFYVLGEHALREARRNGRCLTVLYFDLNGLKKINDALGHHVGSQLLIEAANLLRANFRSSDIVARVGGDEFAVVAHEGRNDLVAALIRLDQATVAANGSGTSQYRISYSMGEATAEPGSKQSFVELVDRADAEMYTRKRGRSAARDVAADVTPLNGAVDTASLDHMATGVMAAYLSQKGRR
ncbi:MAG: GGDEF domain-containing protein [Gammaproteobacteria bacterium]